MTRVPRPDVYTWLSAALFSAPAAVFVVAGAALVLTGDEALGGPAGLGAALALFVALPMLVVEYYAVVRRSRRAASVVASLALYCAALGSLGWVAGLLDLLWTRRSGPGSMGPGEFAVYSAFLACVVAVGLGHLRWRRLLGAAPAGRDGPGG